MTKQEEKFEKWLKALGWLYESQRSFYYNDNDGKHRWFTVDFLVEVDGKEIVVFIDGSEHTRSRSKIADEFQEMMLEHKYNLPYIRISNFDIDRNVPTIIFKRIRGVLITC